MLAIKFKNYATIRILIQGSQRLQRAGGIESDGSRALGVGIYMCNPY